MTRRMASVMDGVDGVVVGEGAAADVGEEVAVVAVEEMAVVVILNRLRTLRTRSKFCLCSTMLQAQEC